MWSCHNKNIPNNVNFALRKIYLTEWHLMATVINTHKDSFMFMTGFMSWSCTLLPIKCHQIKLCVFKAASIYKGNFSEHTLIWVIQIFNFILIKHYCYITIFDYLTNPVLRAWTTLQRLHGKQQNNIKALSSDKHTDRQNRQKKTCHKSQTGENNINKRTQYWLCETERSDVCSLQEELGRKSWRWTRGPRMLWSSLIFRHSAARPQPVQKKPYLALKGLPDSHNDKLQPGFQMLDERILRWKDESGTGECWIFLCFLFFCLTSYTLNGW